MTRITNSDQLAILLRQQIGQLLRKTTSAKGKTAKGERNQFAVSDLSRIQQIAASEEFGESEVQRALIQSLLVEELGEGLMNEAKFQQLIDRVHAIIRDDQDSARLLKDSVRQVIEQK